MKVTFLGATHEVTGSCSFLEAGGEYYLVDYGMEQGENVFVNEPIPIAPGELTAVFLTHAHIDHAGNLPILYKNGFRGPVYATPETCSLAGIMLRDSAHIQVSEAEFQSRKAKRAGGEEIKPAYDLTDVEGLMQLFRPCDYGRMMQLSEHLSVRFTDIGHLLGSACIELWLREGDAEKKIVFSGDVGNSGQPIINDPQPVAETDYLVLESTYGTRLHEPRTDHLGELAGFLQTTLDRGGNVVIPSFAVGRTQELLYFIREIKNSGMVHGHDGFPVYVDSPLADAATSVFMQCNMNCLDDEIKAVMAKGENPLWFDGLKTYVSVEESKALNADPEPKVIIASSGMCDAGRIRHHLKYNLWRPECLILFVGYQASGTTGRALLEGAKSVRILGDEIAVKAQIAELPGISGHADKQGLLDWVNAFRKKPGQIFVNHGDDESCTAFAKCLSEEHGIPAMAPYSGTEYDLARGEFVRVTEGVVFVKDNAERKRRRASDVFGKLVAAAERLLSLARSCEGRSNRDLGRFTDQINQLADRWKE
jgi:metallo-beta-lactamase family protein